MGTYQNGNKSAYNPLFQKQTKKNLRIKEQDLGNRLDRLDNLLSQSANVDDANKKQQEYARLKQELHLSYENKGKGSILWSKTRWIEQGEKPTKYNFLQSKKAELKRKSNQRTETVGRWYPFQSRRYITRNWKLL